MPDPILMNPSLLSLQRVVEPLWLKLYQEADPSKDLPLFAAIQDRTANPPSNPKAEVEWEWVDLFAELREWIGARQTQSPGSMQRMMAKPRPYESTLTFHQDLIGTSGALPRMEELTKGFAPAYARGVFDRAYDAWATNPPCYDGQDLLDTDHPFPDGSTRSNLLTVGSGDVPARAVPADPSVAELRRELLLARRVLDLNQIPKGRLSAPVQVADTLVIARDMPTYLAYQELLEAEKILVGGAEVENTLRGKFQLRREEVPTGTAHTYDVLSTKVGGPRPAIVIKVKEPKSPEFDQSQLFSHKEIGIGIDAVVATAPAFWQGVVRVVEY